MPLGCLEKEAALESKIKIRGQAAGGGEGGEWRGDRGSACWLEVSRRLADKGDAPEGLLGLG